MIKIPQEYRIKDIITSEGDPNKPSTVWITVTWQSDETPAIALPTCKHVELVRNYLLDKYPDNTSLASYFEAAQATTGRGAPFKFANQLLPGNSTTKDLPTI